MRKLFILLALFVSMTMMAEKTWVDLGLPSGTLWASEPEEGYFFYEEAVDSFGINLPTKWQWEELLQSCAMDRDEEGNIVLKSKNGESLVLPTRGWIYKNGKVMNSVCGYFQTFNNFDKKNAWYAFVSFPSQPDHMLWALKDSYKMSVLLVDK